MQWRMPADRAVASGAVILLHILLVLALMNAIHFVPAEKVLKEIPITILFPPPPPPKTEKPKLTPVPAPPLIVPALPRAPFILTLPPKEQLDQNGLRGLGRYLFNCSDMDYEQLSQREWQHCLANNWEPYNPAKVPELGPIAPSPWADELAKSKAPMTPFERPCSPDQPNANLGLPCYQAPAHFPYK